MTPFPDSFAVDDRVYFLIKDPHWTFVWWRVSAETQVRAAAELGMAVEKLQRRIRVHDVTDILFNGGNSHSFRDIAVQGQTDHWYLEIPISGRAYCAEFGYVGNGGFRVVARSRPVYLPREQPSESTEGRFSTIDLA